MNKYDDEQIITAAPGQGTTGHRGVFDEIARFFGPPPKVDPARVRAQARRERRRHRVAAIKAWRRCAVNAAMIVACALVLLAFALGVAVEACWALHYLAAGAVPGFAP